jgi:predicted permease
MIELLTTKMIELFLLMAVGFVLRRRQLITAETLAGLAWIVIDVCMPALFFSGLIRTASNSLENKGFMLLGGFGVSVLGLLVGQIALALSRKSLDNKGTFLFLCAVGNSSFLPLPLAETLWGPAGLQTCLFYIIGNNLFLFSVGISLLAGKGKAEKALYLKGLLHPQALATALALGSLWMGFSWPSWALNAATGLGAATIPLAMLVTGGLLAGASLKTIENKGFIALSQLVKLLALPVLVAVGLKSLGIEGVWAGVLFLEACMPSLASSGVYALRFGGDVKLASEGSFWSHLLSLATVPALFWLFAF